MVDLESQFPDLLSVKDYIRETRVISPAIPRTAAEGEDRTIPRICVCHTVEECLTALGPMGVLRRCLSADEDTKSYASYGAEAYPCIVQTFSVQESCLVHPTPKQVPDVERTHELWLIEDTQISNASLYWLDMYSVHSEDAWDAFPYRKVRSVSLMKNIGSYRHPWVTGDGHFMDSSEEESPDIP